MEGSQYKKQMNHGIQPDHENADIASLSTIGMRIRQAVSNGYNVPGNSYGYRSDAFSETQGHIVRDNISNTFQDRRIPFPSHLQGPPGLTNTGSTIDSCSNLSEWENNYKNNSTIQTLGAPSSYRGKRKFEDDNYETPSMERPQIVSSDSYQMKYGELKFDEDF